MQRRAFLVAGFGAAAFAAVDTPTRAAKVVKLFRSPDGHPNALETAQERLWIGEQTTDRAHLVDWKGKVLKSVETESSNTSGIAFGGGYLWMGANGKGLGRPPRSHDAVTGEVVQVDPAPARLSHGIRFPEAAACMAWNTPTTRCGSPRSRSKNSPRSIRKPSS